MKVSELKQLINEIAMDEVKKTIIRESVEDKMEVYHVKCEGEPIETCNSEEEAQEVVDKLKNDHPGKQFIIEKEIYESHEDMINKLDEMGEELEETENMKNTEMQPQEGNMFTGKLKKAKESGDDSFEIGGKKVQVHEEETEDDGFEYMPIDLGNEGDMDEEECYECGDASMSMMAEEDEHQICECGGQIMEDGCCNECGQMNEQYKQSKLYGSFEDEKEGDFDSGWHNELGDKHHGDFDFDYDEESFDDYDSFNEKHGGKHKWFGSGEEGRKYFDKYKEKAGGVPFRVRSRRDIEEGVCEKCGKEVCECGMYESKKKIRVTESELVAMIKDMVNESMKGDPGTPGVPGLTITKRAQAGSKKENDDNIKSVEKKIKDYLGFEGNDNPEFPHQIGKGEKVARVNTKDQDDEVSKNFAGLQNLDYDIEPDEKFKERQKKAIEGHATMGNAPVGEKPSIKPSNGAEKGDEPENKEGNVIKTPETAKKINKQVKDREKDKKERVLYPKERVPVKTVNESKVSFNNILSEEIQKIKKLSSYNEKTQ